MKPWRLTIPSGLNQELQEHLFLGDGDEHGAAVLAGTCESERGLRLVARELHLAKDGVDYVPGKRGYRMLKAEFIQDLILRARDKRLAYLAIHNHGGTDSVGFSGADMASHERGYPALLDIARGMPVGALVFARSAVAGDLWLPGCCRAQLSQAVIVGHRRQLLFPLPEKRAATVEMYERQSRLFGDAGQDLLRRTRVGIIGLGGAGSVLAELLGRLGVGEFVLADPDRAEESNLPRLIGARARDAVLPAWVPSVFATRLRSTKVRIAARNIRRANPKAQIKALARNFLDDDIAARFMDCDFLFLAADTMAGTSHANFGRFRLAKDFSCDPRFFSLSARFFAGGFTRNPPQRGMDRQMRTCMGAHPVCRAAPGDLRLADVEIRLARPTERRLWYAMVDRHHCPGFRRLPARGLRCVATWRGRWPAGRAVRSGAGRATAGSAGSRSGSSGVWTRARTTPGFWCPRSPVRCRAPLRSFPRG